MPHADLFLEIWREACRHLVLEDSIERIAGLVADHVPADHVVIRQADLTRGAFDTVAVGACRPLTTSVPARTPVPRLTSVPGSTSVPRSTSVPAGSTSVPARTSVPVPGSTSVPARTSVPAAGSTSVLGSTSVAQGRSECDGAVLREVLAWCRGTSVAGGLLPSSDVVLATLAPPLFRGRCLAAPLHSDEGPTGAVLLLSASHDFSDADRQLLARLSEPVAVALANTARVHELTRLREALEADKQALLNKLGRHDVADAVVGVETGLRGVMDQVEHVAGTDVPVLIIGETGSGKEVLARALHERSRRARAPIVRVNCGAIPPGLVDSELFGHERGSFTGAVATRHGWFERADGGTLFLDEIGELPLEAQVRLLRILQDGTFERVGGQRALSVNVRIIAATHRDLREMVARSSFREDLWYRISVFPIQLPPLRERREDIPRLAAHFAARAATRLVGVPLTPTAEDLELLLAYDWPGNVRELAAVIERAAILGAGRVLRVAAALGANAPRPTLPTSLVAAPSTGAALGSLDEAMRQHIELALVACAGRVEGARGVAAVLRINPHTLRARMRKLDIDWSRFRGAAPATSMPDTVMPLDEAMSAHITRVLESTRGRVEGPNGAARRLAINPHTLRARMRKLGVSAAVHRPGRHDLAS